jgi:hypothetical protein
VIDLFVEDRGHEDFLTPLLERLGREHEREVEVRARSARGGHGRAITELGLYQRRVIKLGGGAMPDLLVVAIDANCSSFTAARNQVAGALLEGFRERAIHACPDPHIERWYLADLEAFHAVVGVTPSVGKQKCERGVYKGILARAVVDGGHPATLGGLEFARELAEAQDYFRAGKADSSLKHFLDEAVSRFKAP